MDSEWIDVSIPIRPGMVHWPDNPPVEIDRLLDIEQGDGANVSKISMGTHTGTHMDAPVHFLDHGRGIDRLPMSVAIGRARVIQIRGTKSVNPDELVSHRIRRGERILLKTINSTLFWQSDSFAKDFVHLTSDAAKYLADRGVRMVGIDYLSVGGFNADGAATHRYLLEAGIWIVEGLDLSRVAQGVYELICLPLKIIGGDGAPARVVLKPVRSRSKLKG